MLVYRKHAESVLIFYEKLDTLNTADEVDIILGDSHLDALDPQVF